MDILGPFLIFAGFIAIGLIFKHLQQERESQRVEVLKEKALRIGFEYSERADFLHEELRNFVVFNEGRARETRNYLYGQRDGVKVEVADYNYTVGCGKNQYIVYVTVFIITDPKMNLPHFFMRHQNANVEKHDEEQDVNFDGDPHFSDAFLLLGEEKADIRRIFSEEARRYMLKYHATHVQIEGSKDTLVFNNGERCETQDFSHLLQEVLDIYFLLTDPESQEAAPEP